MPHAAKASRKGGRVAVAKVLPRTLLDNTTAAGAPDKVLARVGAIAAPGAISAFGSFLAAEIPW